MIDKVDTYFMITPNGVFRKDIYEQYSTWSQLPMQLAQRSNQIVKLTQTGRGYTIKNRYSEKKQYFTKKEMVMLSLQAEVL